MARDPAVPDAVFEGQRALPTGDSIDRVARTNAYRRRRWHDRVRPTRPAPATPLLSGPTARRVFVVVLAMIVGASALNLGFRLWDSAESWWPWLEVGAFGVGVTVMMWFLTRPNSVGPWARRTVVLAQLALPLLSVGIPMPGRWTASRGHISEAPAWLQAASAAATAGLAVGWLVSAARGRLWPAPPGRHRTLVDIYASPMYDDDSMFGIAPPPASDGYFQAHCRCGWAGPKRIIESDASEDDAAADAAKHLKQRSGRAAE